MKSIFQIKSGLRDSEMMSENEATKVSGGKRRRNRNPHFNCEYSFETLFPSYFVGDTDVEAVEDDKRRQRPGGGTTTTSPNSFI